MGENEWLNGYLEAILDVGSERNLSRQKKEGGAIGIEDRSSKLKHYKMEENLRFEIQKEKLFSPTKYFVEEVVNSFDESDLHRTWIKVSLQIKFIIFHLLTIYYFSFIYNLTKF